MTWVFNNTSMSWSRIWLRDNGNITYLDISQRSRHCVRLNRSAMKKHALSNPEDLILRYIRTYVTIVSVNYTIHWRLFNQCFTKTRILSMELPQLG